MAGLNRISLLTKMSGFFALTRITSTPCGNMDCNVLFRSSLMILVNRGVVEVQTLTLNHGTAHY